MKKNRLLVLLTLVLSLLLVLAACGSQSSSNESQGSSDTSNNSNETGEKKEEQEAESESKEFDPNDRTDWPKNIRVGAASVGGTYYGYAGGWAGIVADELDVSTTVEVTGGPNHNIQLIENGDMELGMMTMGPGYDAWMGEGEWTNGKQFREYRVMFPMYPSYLHFWSLKGSGITTTDDFNGKNIGVGPKGGTPGTYFPMFYDIMGIDANLSHAGFSDMGTQQLDGLLDVISWAGGVPAATALEISAQKEVNWIGFSKEDRDKIVSELPYFNKAVLPAGTYEGQQEDMNVLAIYNMAIADKDLPDSLVYNIVDAVLSNNEKMLQVHAASKDTIPENIVKNTFAYVHPGAIRWYEEHGIELPDEVYPPDYPKN
jgi:TRAP transporter TAXI family solute receptor